MLTIFATPKPFQGHDNIIQRNAITSWTLLQPSCEIILIGNDQGTSEIASEMGLKHFPDIECNEYGTPLVSSIFQSAQKIARYKTMCYINADIILLSDFLPSIRRISESINKSEFLMVGQRWDLDVESELDFKNSNWEVDLRQVLKLNGELHIKTGIDYFVYQQGLFDGMPPFAIGRTAWDNWLIYKARSLKAAVIDATEAVTIIHQNHDYSHAVNGYIGAWKGPEAIRNQELAGNGKQAFSLEYATFKLTKQGLKHKLSLYYLYLSMMALPVLHPKLQFLNESLAVFSKILEKIHRIFY